MNTFLLIFRIHHVMCGSDLVQGSGCQADNLWTVHWPVAVPRSREVPVLIIVIVANQGSQ